METIVVHGVVVDPTGILKPAPTALSSKATPIVAVLDTGERAVTVTKMNLRAVAWEVESIDQLLHPLDEFGPDR